jgi:hypothetical protein
MPIGACLSSVTIGCICFVIRVDGASPSLARRHAHVYVFALLAHADKTTVDPLDLDQWVFYVLPTAVLDGRTRSQHSITLRTLKGLTAALGFGELRQAVNLAAEQAAPS